MTTEVRPVHSPLGASGAERWMNCAGSVGLLNHLDLPHESDEPDYRSEGTTAHEAAHKCLVQDLDAWEVIGERFGKHEVSAEMAEAIQVYLDEARKIVEPESKVFNEFAVDNPEFHEKFYGTLDRGVVTLPLLRIRDFKYGEGVAVDVEENPQLMYYAYGLLRHFGDEVSTVELGIVQPRAYHPDGRVRTWAVSADYIRQWAEIDLINAMIATEMDADLNAGSWCRFCPAKLVCPLMSSLFGAAMTADPKKLVSLSDASIGRSYQYIPAVKQYLNAMEAEALRRLNTGKAIPGIKLVPKKANRVFKPEASAIFREKYGEEALHPAELKSPAEMEKIDADAKKLVHEWAYTPLTGLTVALESDKRPAVKVQTSEEAFPGAAALANSE